MVAALAALLGSVLCPVPGSAESQLMDQASRAYQEGDYSTTVESIDAAFRAGEISQLLAPTALVIRGAAHAHLGNAQAAWKDVGNAIETSPGEAFVAHLSAEVASILGEPARGLSYADTALRYSPGTPAYRRLRAALLRELGFEELASRDDERVRELRDRDIAWSEEEDARRLCVLGNDQGCVQGLIPLMPDRVSPGTAALLGYLAIDLGEDAWGRELLHAARLQDAQAVETWLYTGLLAYRDGDNTSARSDFLEALARDPRDLRAGLGLIAASPGDRLAALETWQDLIADLPHGPNHDMIFALAGTSDWQAAADHAKAVFATYDGPFVAVAVALLSEDQLALQQRKELIGWTATFQRYGFDDFSRHLADIERRRLGES